VAEIKSRKTEWLGHVLRMESSRVTQQILDGRPEGKGSIGRQRLRWMDDVVNNLKNVEVRKWEIILKIDENVQD
jgi:hypothetical protein